MNSQATTSGAKSQKWKVDIIKGLLVRAQGQEAKFIIRGLQGKLRIGLAQSTVLISLAKAVFLNNPDTIQPISKTELSNITSGKADGKQLEQIMDNFVKVTLTFRSFTSK